MHVMPGLNLKKGLSGEEKHSFFPLILSFLASKEQSIWDHNITDNNANLLYRKST